MENKLRLNLERIPNELKLILELIHPEKTAEPAPLFKNVDWGLFLELVIHHRLFPLLAIQLKKRHDWNIPKEVIQRIEQTYKSNTLYMLQLSAETDKIVRLFNQKHIPVLTLKGPILGADLYGDLSLRSSGDLDILIPIAQLDQADELLKQIGYRKDDYIKSVLNDWKWRHHHVTYQHTMTGMKVEIHWRLNPGPGMEPSFQELWKRRRSSSMTNIPVYYLGREDLFMFLVSHGARHGWSRLRWLMDIDRLVKQDIHWRDLDILLKRYGIQHLGGQALLLASALLKTSISHEMMPLIRGRNVEQYAQEAIFYLERMVHLHSEPVPEEVSAYHKKHLFTLMSKKQKLLFILSFLHPYPEDAETLRLPKGFHFLYFPLRPFLWAWRRTKNHAVS